MQDRLEKMIEDQLKLQIESFDVDPRKLDDRSRAEYLMWNAYALCDEVHEAMAEVGWKPWATSRHVNIDEFRAELIDAFHFLLNMWMASFAENEKPDLMAAVFLVMYQIKNRVNAQRQEDGYDGVSSKCIACHRELTEVDVAKTVSGFGSFDVVDWYCQCGKAIDSDQVKKLGIE